MDLSESQLEYLNNHLLPIISRAYVQSQTDASHFTQRQSVAVVGLLGNGRGSGVTLASVVTRARRSNARVARLENGRRFDLANVTVVQFQDGETIFGVGKEFCRIHNVMEKVRFRPIRQNTSTRHRFKRAIGRARGGCKTWRNRQQERFVLIGLENRLLVGNGGKVALGEADKEGLVDVAAHVHRPTRKSQAQLRIPEILRLVPNKAEDMLVIVKAVDVLFRKDEVRCLPGFLKQQEM